MPEPLPGPPPCIGAPCWRTCASTGGIRHLGDRGEEPVRGRGRAHFRRLHARGRCARRWRRGDPSRRASRASRSLARGCAAIPDAALGQIRGQGAALAYAKKTTELFERELGIKVLLVGERQPAAYLPPPADAPGALGERRADEAPRAIAERTDVPTQAPPLAAAFAGRRTDASGAGLPPLATIIVAGLVAAAFTAAVFTVLPWLSRGVPSVAPEHLQRGERYEGKVLIQAARTFDRPAPSGSETLLRRYASYNEQCEQVGLPQVTVLSPPAHGSVDIRQDSVVAGSFWSYQAKCVGRIFAGTGVYYRAQVDYRRSDSVTYRVYWQDLPAAAGRDRAHQRLLSRSGPAALLGITRMKRKILRLAASLTPFETLL